MSDDVWRKIAEDQRLAEIEQRLEAIERLLEIVLGTRDADVAAREMAELRALVDNLRGGERP